MTEQNHIITETYRLTPTAHLKVAAGAMLPTFGWISSILLSAAIIASIFDIRFVFMALIIFFILIPMMMSYIYFSKLLTVEAQRSLSPKHILIIPGQSITEIPESADESSDPLPSQKRLWTEIADCRKSGNIIVIDFTDRQQLLIPLKVLPGNIPLYKIFPSIPT